MSTKKMLPLPHRYSTAMIFLKNCRYRAAMDISVLNIACLKSQDRKIIT
jgi:hypothetical protein